MDAFSKRATLPDSSDHKICVIYLYVKDVESRCGVMLGRQWVIMLFNGANNPIIEDPTCKILRFNITEQ